MDENEVVDHHVDGGNHPCAEHHAEADRSAGEIDTRGGMDDDGPGDVGDALPQLVRDARARWRRADAEGETIDFAAMRLEPGKVAEHGSLLVAICQRGGVAVHVADQAVLARVANGPR